MLTEAETADDLRAPAELHALEVQICQRGNDLRKRIAALDARAARGEDIETELAALRYGLCCLVSDATHENYSPDEVALWVEHAVRLGVDPPAFTNEALKALIYYKRVPNMRLREAAQAAERDGRSFRSVTEELSRELIRVEQLDCANYGSGRFTRHYPEDNRPLAQLNKELGMSVETSQGQKKVRYAITYEVAEALARVLGVPPHEVGI